MKTPTAIKQKSGNWRVQLMVDGQKVSITRQTKREAEQAAIAMKLSKQRKASGKLNLSEAIDEYISLRERVLSASTVEGYRNIQRNRFQAYMSRPVARMDARMCQRMVNDESGTVSAKTLTNAWRFIASVIREQTGETISVRLPQVINRDLAWLDADQIKVLMSAVEGEQIELPILLGLHTITRSEMLAIRWEDIDLNAGIIHIRGAVVQGARHQMIYQQENKNQNRRRDIPILIPRLLEVLTEQQGAMSSPVVTVSESTLYKQINRTCRENGLPEVGFHGLRRSAASLCWELKVDPKVVRRLGGWSNDQTVLKIYTKISQSREDSELTKLRDFFE